MIKSSYNIVVLYNEMFYKAGMKKIDKHELADKHREGMRQFMRKHGFKTIASWSEASGVGQGTITNFLRENEPSSAMESHNLYYLASCVGASISEMLGETVTHVTAKGIDSDILRLAILKAEEGESNLRTKLTRDQRIEAICNLYEFEIERRSEDCELT